MKIRARDFVISFVDSMLTKVCKNDDPRQPLLTMILSKCIITLHYLTKSLVNGEKTAHCVDSWEQQNYNDDYLSAVNSTTNDSQHEDSHENVSYRRMCLSAYVHT